MSKVHNFSAGPCVLPQEVFEKSAQAILNFNDTGLSLIEKSHRDKDFVEVMDNAVSLVKELLNVPSNYEVLFLQGGASLQFLMAAMNFLPEDGKAGYVVTGTWAKKAFKEAQIIGNAIELASSADKNFSYMPKGFDIPADLSYMHLTSNNTIFGTQIKDFPKSDVPVICDMSSDIFSREINVADFDLIYAGAQKNMGPAGATLVIVNKDKLGKSGRTIPTMLDYNTHISKDSMFNTPPVFAVYASMLTLEWLKKNGGVSWIEKINQEKADLLYSEIDRNSMFKGTAAKEDRSNMNACFLLTDESKADEFNKMWQEAKINGLKGHRSVGGYRASMYNALSVDSVRRLVDLMQEFENKFA